MSFLRSLPAYGPARDAYLLGAIATGNLDEPEWVDVQCGPVTLSVSSDFLKIQSERVPMAAYVAQAACDALGALLPTPKIVEAIDAAATIVAMPTRPPDGNKQLSAEWIAWCEEETQRRMVGISGLVAGHRKDVVIVRAMAGRPGRVWIFGARWPDGRRIEVTAHGGHEAAYNDYSHGTRAIRDACLVNGEPASVSEILKDPARAGWLSSEGALTVVRYPTATTASKPAPAAPTPAKPNPATTPATTATWTLPEGTTLRRGHRGPLVAELQRRLSAAGFVVTRDSLFGNATESAVMELQSERGLEVDGVVGPQTRKALGWVLPEEEDTEPGDIPDVPSILSDAEADALFGPLLWVPAPTATEPGAVRITNNWTKDNLRRVVIPQLRGVQGAPQDGGIYLHRLIVEQTRSLFAAWEAAGLRGLLLSWAGSWNPRLVRGGSTLSRHSYATSFDVNAAWNPMGKPAAPKGAKGSVIELIPLAVEHGYTNGMNWSRPDAMHMECFRVL